MDFGPATKAAPVTALNPVTRSDAVAPRDSVAVELPPERTVQSAAAGDAVKLELRRETQDATDARRQQDETASQDQASSARADARRQQDQRDVQNLRDVIERRLVIEPRTRSVVVEKRNVETGERVSLLPDEATLKLRMYTRELTERARAENEPTSRYVERTA